MLLLFLLLLVLLPVAFGQLFAAALLKLRLEPLTAVVIVTAMILGGGINIPVKRIVRASRWSRTRWPLSACRDCGRGSNGSDRKP